MSLLTPEQQFEDLKSKIKSTIQKQFPIKSTKSELVVNGVEVEDDLSTKDLRSQKKAIREGKSWTVPVYADISLRRGNSEIDRKKVLVMHLPKVTDRFGYIIDGNEYQSLNQLRLKSGVYHRIAGDGSIRAEYNLENPSGLSNGRTLSVEMDPDEAVFYLKHRNSRVPIYHLLKGVGVDDDSLERAWGKEILQKNKTRLSEEQAVKRFYQAVNGSTPSDWENQKDLFGTLLKETRLRPDTTKVTLGKEYKTVNGEVLLKSTENLLGISKGVRVEDDKASLRFQSIHSFEDLVDDQVRKGASKIKRKILNNIDKKRSVKSVVTPGIFDKSVRGFFTTSLVAQPEQVNPLEMISGQNKTTIMGESGGYKSPYAVLEEAKLVNPSHLSFLDPIQTPEGEKTGISLSIPIAANKKGTELQALMQRRDGTRVRVGTAEALEATVAYPDQYDRKGKKLIPRSSKVKATKNGKVSWVDPKEVDYIVPSALGLFGITSNLVPFLQNDQGNRAMMAVRQLEQAVPLEYREAARVQAVGEDGNPIDSKIGEFASIRSPVDGTVVKVKSDSVVIKSGRKQHEVQFYKDFPLKGTSLYDSEPRVRVGDKVKAGQLIADSTFTKDGVLALGTGLKSVTGDTLVLVWNSGVPNLTRFDEILPVSDTKALTVEPEAPFLVEELPVRAFIVHESKERIVRVKTASGRFVDTTESHSFVVFQDGRLVEKTPNELELKKFWLPRIRYVELPEIVSSVEISSARKKREQPLTPAFGFLLGLYLAEGHSVRGNVHFATSDSYVQERVREYARLAGFGDPVVRINTVTVSVSELAAHLRTHAGHLAQNKKVPSYVFGASKEFRKAVLGGYWAGDGTVTGTPVEASASTASCRLRDGLVLLCSSLGIDTTLSDYEGQRRWDGTRYKHCWVVRISSKSLPDMPFIPHEEKERRVRAATGHVVWDEHDMIPLWSGIMDDLRFLTLKHFGGKKANPSEYSFWATCRSRGFAPRTRLADILKNFGSTKSLEILRGMVQNTDVSWDRVESVEDVKYKGLVYDFDMGQNPNFSVATGIVVHNTAYMPFRGYNFEDGIVISDDAAKKLTSLHLYKKDASVDADTVMDKRKFLTQHPYVYKKDQLAKVGDNGVIEVGSEVHPGDPLILSMRKPEESQLRNQIQKFRRGRPDKYRDRSVAWDKDTTGIVTDVIQRGKDTVVYVKTKEPAQIGDKVVGRHANKGVITKIIPTAEMPYTETPDGKKSHMDILLNPMGIPGRINLGQVLETAASKISEKEGKTYKIKNFEAGVDYLNKVKTDLKKAGLTDKEVLINPETGKPYDQKVFVGNQYILKLKHQVDKKMSARSGTGGDGSFYDINHSPAGGAPHGGQSIGELGLYSLLAHGARENIHEAYGYKSSRNEELWNALREGTPIPPPKVPFAYDKFLGYLNAMRVNVRKDGNSLMLVPFTESQIKELSSGELKEPGQVVRGKDGRPIKDGLFDEKLTGGMQGERWTHFTLSEPMPNPMFEGAIKKLTDISDVRFRNIVRGDEEINGKRGGAAIEEILKGINVKRELEDTRKKIEKAKGAGRAKLHNKLRILKALDQENLDPTVYMMKSVPVLPPKFRPVVIKDDGSLSTNDINGLYMDLGAVNSQLTNNKRLGIPDTHMRDQRESLYDGLKALTGTGGALTREYSGILDIIAGKTRSDKGDSGASKRGFFQQKVMKRRQDFSGRSIIVPEPSMDIDEIGLPEDIAWSMYQPFIDRELTRQGYKPLDAFDEVRRRTPIAEKALQRAIEDKPILLKRDPSLHKFNVMAFKPRLVKGKAIEIHPLITGGYNADFDGDCFVGQVLVDTSQVGNYVPGKDETAYVPHLTSFANLSVVEIADFPRVEESARVTAKGVVKYDVPEGVKVPAFHPEGTRMLQVTEFSVHPDCEEWIAKSMNGRESCCSSDHSLVVLNPETLKVEKCPPRDVVGKCFPVLSDVREGAVASLPGVEAGPGGNRMLQNVPLSLDVGWFIGATIGDGWAARQGDRYKGVCLSYGEGDEAVADRWESMARILTSGADSRVRLPHEFDGGFYTSIRSTVSSGALGEWVGKLIGHGSRGKHLPAGCLDWILEARQGLFCGLIDTDGSVNWNKNDRFAMSFTTTSTRLANDVRLLGLSLGLPCSLTEFENRGKPAYILTFSVRPVQNAYWIKLSSDQKQSSLNRLRDEAEKDFGRNDIVPLPESVRANLIELCRTGGATRRQPHKNKELFSYYVILKREQPFLTRTTYLNIAKRFKEEPALDEWFRVCEMPVAWDVYESAEPTGETRVMYDITVPGSWTFATADGSFVWDTMSVYLPVTPKAQKEAEKMYPSNNLFSPTSGAIMYTPGHEALLGMYLLSQPGNRTSKKFKTTEEALAAERRGEIKATDIISVKGAETTAGRLQIESVLPTSLRETGKKKVSEMRIFDKKTTKGLLSKVGKGYPSVYGEVSKHFNDLGNSYSTDIGFSVGLSDFEPINVDKRDSMIREGEAKARKILAGSGNQREKDAKIVEIFKAIDDELDKINTQYLEKHPTNIYQMVRSGSRGSPEQLKQIVSSPMLVMDAKNRVVPLLIPKSYSEGMDVASYMTTLQGARKGTIQKVQGVKEPGYLSKQIMNSTMNQLITIPDCHAGEGIPLSIDDNDIADRYLASSVKLNGKVFKGGTLVTPEIIAAARKNKRSTLPVRTPLRCRAEHGICQACMGLTEAGKSYDIGANVGVIAGQAIGEPSSQLSMNSFHTGGIAKGKGAESMSMFERLKNLLTMQGTVQDKATLSTLTGKVSKIVKAPQGGEYVVVGDRQHYVPTTQTVSVRPADKVEKGEPVSSGIIDPRELLNLKDMNSVQDYITNELHKIMATASDVKRRNMEVVVKSLTDVTSVDSPGGHPDWEIGDVRPLSEVRYWNAHNRKKPVEHTPILKGVNVLPLEMQEDWIARLNFQNLSRTLTQASREGWRSNIHGFHPVPAAARAVEFGRAQGKVKEWKGQY